jgi:hypothetical protein
MCPAQIKKVTRRITVTKLTNYEKETIILFNEDEPDADIFTYNKRWQKHLEEKCGIQPYKTNESDGRSYKINKFRIKPPRAKKKLTPKQLQNLRLHAQKRKKKDDPPEHTT